MNLSKINFKPGRMIYAKGKFKLLKMCIKEHVKIIKDK
jgi:hypothetical protein